MTSDEWSEAPRPEDLLLQRYQAVQRVDDGERIWTYYAESWGNRRAALKVWNPRFGAGGGLIEEAEVGMLNHPCIPMGLDLGKTHPELYFYIREWVDGVTFDELVSSPPSRENTTRLCRALLRLAETIAALHRDDEHGPSRVHGALRGRDVIVTPDGDVRVINFDRSHLADVPVLEPINEADTLYVLTTDSVSSKRRDLDSLLTLFRRLWEPLGASVVSLDALVPRPIADLRYEAYDSPDVFRADLEIALTIAGMAPVNTAYDAFVR